MNGEKHIITIAALGPDSGETLTLGVYDALNSADRLLLRTGRHGVAERLTREGVAFETLDALYERTEDFDELCELAARAIIDRARQAEALVYAVSEPQSDATVRALADALPLPLFLYNMPSHVKVFLEPATVKALADHPNIVGLKDSSANMTYFQTLLYHLGDREDFALYVGPEELTGESVVMGADGGVNGGANIFPELYVEMYDAAAAHDIARVRRLQHRIMQISTSLYTVGKYGSSYLKGVKCALSLLGICDDYLSYPYRKFRTEERDRIRQALGALGIKCGE